MKTFRDLGVSEALIEVLADKNIKAPTPIQQQAIPKILAGTDILGVAPTGTGKTLAYLLPILMQLDKERREAQAVVLAPTYELAMQITDPDLRLSRSPSLSTTSTTWLSVATMMTTTSASRPTSAGLAPG